MQNKRAVGYTEGKVAQVGGSHSYHVMNGEIKWKHVNQIRERVPHTESPKSQLMALTKVITPKVEKRVPCSSITG